MYTGQLGGGARGRKLRPNEHRTIRTGSGRACGGSRRNHSLPDEVLRPAARESQYRPSPVWTRRLRAMMGGREGSGARARRRGGERGEITATCSCVPGPKPSLRRSPCIRRQSPRTRSEAPIGPIGYGKRGMPERPDAS